MNWIKRLLAGSNRENSLGESTIDEKYRPGQLWRYRARPQDEGSVILIGKVERLPRRPVVPGQLQTEETVIGVQVRNLAIKAAPPSEEVLTEISHLPLDRLALEASVIELVQDRVAIPASFVEGYRDWRKVFDRGAAAYYKYPIAQCVELAERAFNQT